MTLLQHRLLMVLQGAATVRLMPWPNLDLRQSAEELRRQGFQRQGLARLSPLEALHAVVADRMAGQVVLFLALAGLLAMALWSVVAGTPDWVSLTLAASVPGVWLAVQWLASRELR